jgi:hypothetical protein
MGWARGYGQGLVTTTVQLTVTQIAHPGPDTMHTLLHPDANATAIARIGALRADTKPQWGKMTCVQMLVHCQRALQSGVGELKLKRRLPGLLFGGYARRRRILPAHKLSEGIPPGIPRGRHGHLKYEGGVVREPPDPVLPSELVTEENRHGEAQGEASSPCSQRDGLSSDASLHRVPG